MRLHLIAAAALAICSSAANAQYTQNIWDHVWTFDNDAQGWSLNGGAFWNNAGGVGGSGGISTPDTANATIDIESIVGRKLGGNAGQYKFILQADIFLTNLGNYHQGQGLAAIRNGDNKGPMIYGSNAGNRGISAFDSSWETAVQRRSNAYSNATTLNNWHTLQIDYGYTVPGQWTAWIQINGSGAAGVASLTLPTWYNIYGNSTTPTYKAINPDPAPLGGFSKLLIGGWLANGSGGSVSGTPWGQMRVDNVKIVPEPGSFVALGAGLASMAGLVLRKRN